MIIKSIRGFFSIASFLLILFVAADVALRWVVSDSLRLKNLPDGKSVFVTGRVVEARAIDGDNVSVTLEDHTGFVEVTIPRAEQPPVGSMVLINGKKWQLEGQAVVVGEEALLRM